MTYKLNESQLIEIISTNNISYSKIKSGELGGDQHFEIYFNTEKELELAVNKLNLRRYSGLYCKIVNYRINMEYLMIYVIPFKNKILTQTPSDRFNI